MGTGATSGRLKELNAMRGILAAGVILFHYGGEMSTSVYVRSAVTVINLFLSSVVSLLH